MPAFLLVDSRADWRRATGSSFSVQHTDVMLVLDRTCERDDSMELVFRGPRALRLQRGEWTLTGEAMGTATLQLTPIDRGIYQATIELP